MKHVFIIHSHITFLASISIVDQLRLKEEEICFLFGRKYRNVVQEITYKIYDIDEIFAYDNRVLISAKYRKRFIDRIDTFVGDAIDNEYVAYVPQLLTFGHQVLVTNKKCRSFHLFQESAKPLFGKANPIKRGIKRLLLLMNDRIWAQDDYYISEKICKKYSGIVAWSFNRDYYYKLEHVEKRFLEFPDIQIDIDYNTNYPFFILEAAIEAGLIEKEVFMEGCDLLVKEYAEKRNYIKFHPGQSEENRQKILTMFEKYSKKAILIEDGIPFELIIAKYKNLKIIGFTSSLIFFSQDAGHHVIAKGAYLTEHSRKFRRFINRLG